MKVCALLFPLLTACLPSLAVQSQSLADIAKDERKRRKRQQAQSRVYTNEDLSKYGSQFELNSKELRQSAKVEKAHPDVDIIASSLEQEHLWSARFIEARARLQEAQKRQKMLGERLQDLTGGCGPDTYYDSFYFFHTNRLLGKTKKELAAAEQGLEQLGEQLRKSGNPASWESSQLGLQFLTEETHQPEPAKAKDEKYWKERLSVIDKRYSAILAPLEVELFELVNRRPPRPSENATIKGGLGACVPRFVVEISAHIKALRQEQEREKTALVEEARREGALPGWFR